MCSKRAARSLIVLGGAPTRPSESELRLDLRNASAPIRIVAAAGLFWISIVFVLTFTDYLSRHY
jgi:hypothetical protein